MTIRFVCENRIQFQATTVSEKECHYTVTMATEFGCPSECDRPESQVCGSNGFCGYDTDKKAPGCFCDQGYAGISCLGSSSDGGGSPDNSKCDGVCVALIFVFLLLLGLIATSVIILMRVRKMNELNVRFAALAEDLNPNGEGDETFELQDHNEDSGMTG